MVEVEPEFFLVLGWVDRQGTCVHGCGAND
jgi:hypothetical protein